MNRLIRKLFTLFSLFALVASPIEVRAITYDAPIIINNPTPAFQDSFGDSVFVSGDKVLIGASGDDTLTTNAGTAYLYDTMGVLLQTFKNPTSQQYDGFGVVSISGSGGKVLIGAPGDNTGANDAGSAYLFDVATGNLLHTFNNPTPEYTDLFGVSVSISGDKVLIGAPNDDTGARSAGTAYLYDAITGALLRTFNNPIPAEGSHFGRSVFIFNDNVLIGTPEDDTGAYNAGSAYLYDAITGELLQTFNNPTPEPYDNFGGFVSIYGNKIAIGAPNDSTGALYTGSVYIYDAISGVLLQTFNNPTPEYLDHFGNVVSISGDRVLIGAVNDDTGATDAGSAYLYDAPTGALLQTFNNPTPANGEFFGKSVSISSGTVLVGASGDNGAALATGSAYLYLLLPDTDSDGIEDGIDNCPADANVDQTDTDGDGQGNLCDFTPNGDTDGDGVDELADNCPGIANAGQEDNDSDGIGNVCDPTPDGDPNPNPTSTDQCKQLDWMEFGFRNQGQCVAFVNTGHDSR